MRPRSSAEILPAGMPSRVPAVILVCAILAAAVFVPGRVRAALAVNAHDNQQDFGTFYRGAHCLFGGGCDPYAVVERSTPDLAPPHAHLVIVPVTWLGREPAYVAWLAISVVVIAAVVFRVARELAISWSPLEWACVAVIVAGSGAMMSLVTSGQIYAVLTWPVTSAWIAWRRGQFSRAAAWIAIGASVKVLLALPLVWFVVHRRWRAALVLAGTMAAIFGVGLAIFGVGAYGGWLEMLSRSPLSGHFRDGAIMAALTRTFGESSSFAPAATAPWLIRPIWAISSGLVVALALLKPADPDRTVLAVVAAATLAAPIGWIYAAWWFLGPAAAVSISASRGVRWMLGIAVALLWLPDTTPLFGQPAPWLTPLVGSMYFWVWLMFWGAGMVSPRRAHAAP